MFLLTLKNSSSGEPTYCNKSPNKSSLVGFHAYRILKCVRVCCFNSGAISTDPGVIDQALASIKRNRVALKGSHQFFLVMNT